jgi:hypothetical protein
MCPSYISELSQPCFTRMVGRPSTVKAAQPTCTLHVLLMLYCRPTVAADLHVQPPPGCSTAGTGRNQQQQQQLLGRGLVLGTQPTAAYALGQPNAAPGCTGM